MRSQQRLRCLPVAVSDPQPFRLPRYLELLTKPGHVPIDWCLASQVPLYTACVSQSVDVFLEGYNATVLMYGQTGSGKTFTCSEITPQVAR